LHHSKRNMQSERKNTGKFRMGDLAHASALQPTLAGL
jgi:hypothetical protein